MEKNVNNSQGGLMDPSANPNGAGEIRDRIQPLTPERQAEGGRVQTEHDDVTSVGAVPDTAIDVPPDTDEDDEPQSSRYDESTSGYEDSIRLGTYDDDCFLEPSCD